MSAQANARFEELVSKYVNAELAPEEEAELLALIEKPAFEEAFFEMTRLNGEISGLLASPVPDERMESLVAGDLPAASKKSSRMTAAVMSSLPDRPDRRPAAVAAQHIGGQDIRPASSMRSITLPWAISICLHAAAIILFVITFGLKRETTQPGANPAQPIAQAVQAGGESESIARVGSLNGDTYTIEASGKNQVIRATDLAEGQGLETVGHGSTADVTFDDGTSVVLDANTRVKRVSIGAGGQTETGQSESSQGKRVILETGTLRVSAAKQPAEKPMEFVTQNAKAVVVGTRFKLTSSAGSTRLEVTEGLVRLARLDDKTSINVKAGQFAIIEAGKQLIALPLPAGHSRSFVRGINFFGDAVTIEGERWLSHNEALRKGLDITANIGDPKSHTTNVPMVPTVDADTNKMLNTRAFSMGQDLALTQPLDNGRYDVFLWIAEGHSSNFRLFDVQIGSSVWRGVGRLNKGEWKKYGPFRATVADGKLKIVLKSILNNPLICGLSIYSAPPDSSPDE